jgi:hypothetical protein
MESFLHSSNACDQREDIGQSQTFSIQFYIVLNPSLV